LRGAEAVTLDFFLNFDSNDWVQPKTAFSKLARNKRQGYIVKKKKLKESSA
jgi:hypothetical protein